MPSNPNRFSKPDRPHINQETNLRAMINLDRVQMTEQSGYLIVTYGNRNYLVASSEESVVIVPHSHTRALRQETIIRLTLDPSIFNDTEVPSIYREVIVFHLIRRKEYMEAGFEDDFERAKNDEILYITKYFPAHMQKDYFRFAEKYRKAANEKKNMVDGRRAATKNKIGRTLEKTQNDEDAKRNLRAFLAGLIGLKTKYKNGHYFNDDTDWLTAIDFDETRPEKITVIVKKAFAYLITDEVCEKYNLTKCPPENIKLEFGLEEYDSALACYKELIICGRQNG